MPFVQVSKGRAQPIRGAGDLVHLVALPVAAALGMDCVDKATGQLKPDSRCAGHRASLNRTIPFTKKTP